MQLAQRSATTSRVASFRSTNSIVKSSLANSARSRVITSAARLASRMVRRAVSRAPSMFGGSAASIRRHGASVGDDARQRLIHFVGDRGRQRTQGRHSGHVGQLRAELAERFLRSPLLGHVLHRGDIQQASVLIPGRLRDHVQVLDRAVRQQQPVVVLEIGTVAQLAVEHLLECRNVFRV